MQFSAFIESISGNTILLRNTEPIENVKTIVSYSDNSNGTFSKKEIRWSFNQVYWSSWQTLTPYSITHINTHLNPYLYLEIRYVLSSIGSGTVTTFNINYTLSETALTPPIDIVQRYDTISIYDASLLNGWPGSWYLNRTNHTGQQTIATIVGLQTILNSLISASGVTYAYVDSSFGTRDLSINQLYNLITTSDVSLLTNYYTKDQIDASFYDVVEASTLFYTKDQIDENILWTIDSSTITLKNTSNTVQLNNLNIQENLIVEVEYFYMGDPLVDNSWRWSVDESTNLRFEKLISGTWVYKSSII
jgi:hypothetical protein